MKFFADSSYLGNAYYAGGNFEAVARRTRNKVHPIIISVAVLLEFRLGSLWSRKTKKAGTNSSPTGRRDSSCKSRSNGMTFSFNSGKKL